MSTDSVIGCLRWKIRFAILRSEVSPVAEISAHDSGTNANTHGTTKILQLGGGFKYFLFSPLPGEMIQID